MSFSPLIEHLISSLRCLPGIGPKSAQRMAIHLLQRNRDGGKKLAEVLRLATEKVGHCTLCRTLTEETLCPLCANPKRDKHKLCIVEQPTDVIAIEQSACFNGHYFVLMGHLSPIDGIGPGEIGIDQLAQRLQTGSFTEIILATNPTVEGEATAHFIAELASNHQIPTSRIAHGVPLGGELEYLDSNTIALAIGSREKI